MELLPTTLPLASAGNRMLHIQRAGDQNGVFQFFGGGAYYAGAWIDTLSGAADIQLVNGTPAVTTLLNQWECYSHNAAGADFYVDLVAVDTNPIVPESLAAPEPSSFGLIFFGAASLFAGRRFRKRS
jgi:hypothetical protein